MAFKLTARDLFKTTFKSVFKYLKEETAKDPFKTTFITVLNHFKKAL